MDNFQWIQDQYENARRPFSQSRSEELRILIEYGRHYGRTLEADAFDLAIAEKFGDGCEYEWARD